MNSKPQRHYAPHQYECLKWNMAGALKKSAYDSVERTRQIALKAEETVAVIEKSGVYWKVVKARDYSNQIKEYLGYARKKAQYVEKTGKNTLPRPGRTLDYRVRMTHLVQDGISDVLHAETKMNQLRDAILKVHIAR